MGRFNWFLMSSARYYHEILFNLSQKIFYLSLVYVYIDWDVRDVQIFSILYKAMFFFKCLE